MVSVSTILGDAHFGFYISKLLSDIGLEMKTIGIRELELCLPSLRTHRC